MVYPNGSGSGVITTNGSHSYVWTCAHVLAHLRDRDGNFPVFTIYTENTEGGRKVSDHRYLATLLKIGEADDIALLKVWQRNFGKGVRFSRLVPALGAPLWHVGSMRGVRGHNSVSEGCIAAVGRLDHGVWDQACLTFHFGSSGGGVWDKRTGVCYGLIAAYLYGDPLTFGTGFVVPSRRIWEFAEREGVLHTVDDNYAVPMDE